MNIVFINDCAADGCNKKNLGSGNQLCEDHSAMYDNGVHFKAFYGKTILKRGFQNSEEKCICGSEIPEGDPYDGYCTDCG